MENTPAADIFEMTRLLKAWSEGVETALVNQALDDALNELAIFEGRRSKIVEPQFFGGLSLEETAEAVRISTRTVRREWSLAQARLYRELGRGE